MPPRLLHPLTLGSVGSPARAREGAFRARIATAKGRGTLMPGIVQVASRGRGGILAERRRREIPAAPRRAEPGRSRRGCNARAAQAIAIVPMSSSPGPTTSPAPFESPIRLREVRLISGLVLGTFLLTHFSNHALGLVSIEAMEKVAAGSTPCGAPG
jgi:hypothetical protein